ncbi:MAG TPA: MATE family efflux transporter [Sandaracinaceae bacterium LLY-WYZ-13_1]|nr:MATE family efflux transporter [Sandaracinaceae bacterium LLY-WYZ-13_1]
MSTVAPTLRSMSPTRAVWAVAWPMMALGLLRSLYYLTDSFWVGRLGPRPLAALGGSAFAWWMIHLTCRLPATGVHSLVARHEGAGDRTRIARTVSQGLWVGLGLAALLALAAYPARGLYFDLLGFDPAAPEHALGQRYVGAALLGASSLAVFAIVDGAFRGLGETRTALALTAATILLNAIVDPLLIWGPGPLPALGIAGAAWATALANLVGAALGTWLLAARGHRPRVARPHAAALARIARIGAPVSLSGVGFALVYVLLGRVITGFGSEQMAALGVGHRLEGLAFLACVAFGVGASTMVGQHAGAGDLRRARASARAAARLSLLAMVPFTLLLFAGAGPLFDLFTDDPATIEAGVRYLRIQTAVLALMALEEVYKGAFTGAGDTLAASIITFGFTAARIPAAWLLADPLGLGIAGVWIAIAGSTAVKGVAMWIWWRRDGWTRRAAAPA